jgi:hypothetical protein
LTEGNHYCETQRCEYEAAPGDTRHSFDAVIGDIRRARSIAGRILLSQRVGPNSMPCMLTRSSTRRSAAAICIGQLWLAEYSVAFPVTQASQLHRVQVSSNSNAYTLRHVDLTHRGVVDLRHVACGDVIGRSLLLKRTSPCPNPIAVTSAEVRHVTRFS